MAKLIRNPIITDDFPDHNQRRLWKDQLAETAPEIRTFMQLNKLGLNHAQAIYGCLSLLGLCLEESKEMSDKYVKFKDLRKAIDLINFVNYDGLTLEEKKTLMRSLDLKVLEILNLFRNT